MAAQAGDRNRVVAADAPAAAATGGVDAGALAEFLAEPENSTLFAALSPDAAGLFIALYAREWAPRLDRARQLDRDYGGFDDWLGPHRRLALAMQGLSPQQAIICWHTIECGLADGRIKNRVLAEMIQGFGGDLPDILLRLNRLRGFPGVEGIA